MKCSVPHPRISHGAPGVMVMRPTPEPAPRDYAPCDCGQPGRKTYGGWVCDRCRFLEGFIGARPESAELVVDALRNLHHASLIELVDATGRDRRSLIRTMVKLLDCGRVRRWLAERQYEARLWGPQRLRVAGVRTTTEWIYALDG